MRRKTTALVLDWTKLVSRHKVDRCAHHWVSDESIRAAIASLRFDDPRKPHSEKTNRAERIAAIVVMMDAGVVFPPLYMRVERRSIRLGDGHHRLRAYQYRNRIDAIPVRAYGWLSTIRHAVVA